MKSAGKSGKLNLFILLQLAFVLAAGISMLAGSSCKEKISEISENSIGKYNNHLIIEWNKTAYDIARAHDQFYSFKGVRALAMVHIAMHDALNAIDPEYKFYSYSGSEPGADPAAACSQAAFEVLINVYPEKSDTLQIVLEKWLSQIADEKAKNSGLELGKNSAASILQKREGDEYNKVVDYAPGNEIGDYQYTPEFNWVLAPGFSFAKPFGLSSADQFRSPQPPEINSSAYINSYNEVKALGAEGSTTRSTDQTNFAYWWAEFAEHSLNRIGRLTAEERKLSLWETARMFALINMTLYDIYLAVVDSKYFHNRWRPYTAIRMAESDGNPDTVPDTGWIPEMLTPPWPEYPSAHAACIIGGFEIIKHVYNTSGVYFSMESTTALPGNKIRSYNNMDSAAEECAESRIMNGFHFRFSTEEGKKQGRKVANYIISNYLQPLK